MLADDFFLGTKLYHKKFTELCKPLAKYLGVTHAIYINVDGKGRMFSICTDYKWTERFLEEKYYRLDPFMVHPNNIHNGFSFDHASDDQEFKDMLLYDAVVNFNWCNSFAYIEKNPTGGYVGFDFGTTKDNYQMINRLINEAQIVKKAIRHLHNKLTLIISKDLQENKMDFAALKGDLFYSQRGLVFNEQYETQNKIQLLQEVGILGGKGAQSFFDRVSLSPQEINCLRLYLATRNIKKVSGELELAITTVTSYIENIKTKLNCSNKNELFEQGEILESLGRI